MSRYLLAMVAMFMVLPVLAIDTVTIELDPYNNNYDLKLWIDADKGAHVYKLLQGGYYYVDGTIENYYTVGEGESQVTTTFPIILVGEEGPGQPPVVMFKTDEQGHSPDVLFRAKDHMTFKNLYLVGVDDRGAYKNMYTTSQKDVRLVVENCVCNYANDFRGFFEFNSYEGSAIMKNNVAMNMMRGDGYVWSTWFNTVGTKPDTLIFTNNTVFNSAFNFFSLDENEISSPNYALVEHNTVVNTAKEVLHFSYWLNLEHRNNLYYNVMYQGDSEFSSTEFTNRIQCPDHEPYAFIKADTIPKADWRDSMLNAMGMDHRIIQVHNNNFFQTDHVTSIPGMAGKLLIDTANTIYRDSGNVVGLMSPRTQSMFDDDAAYPGLEYLNNTQEDPGLTNDPSNPDDLVAHALMLYRRKGEVNIHFDTDKESNPGGYQTTFDWPIWGVGGIIDFSYSNPSLVATDGFHLGDLYHWYPGEYMQWYSGMVGVKDDAKPDSRLRLFPNPASDQIHLNRVTDVVIYNLNGQKVKSVRHSDVVNISDMAHGIYFVKDREGYVVKLVVR